jgi:hypothetical protein
MRGTLVISTAALGLGAAVLFAVPAHAVPWGQGDYYDRSHAANCDCISDQAGAAAQPSQTTVAKQNRPAGVQDNSNGANRLQR